MVPGQVLSGITAQLGGLLLSGVDAAGVAWTLGDLQGWDSADVQATLTNRSQDHGAWWSPVYLGARPITITGTITAPDAGTLDAAIDQLLTACPLTDTTLTVYQATPRQATVRRSGKPVIAYQTDTVATYSLLVTAQDPRRYSTTFNQVSTPLPSISGGLVLPATAPLAMSATTVAGSITALNSGTFATRPVFTISGPVSQPIVATLYPDGTVKALSYSGTDLAAGDQLVIDTDAHTVQQGGASRRRWISGTWPDIPAGTQVQIQFRAATYNANALLTAAWRSAWI
jgi:hypothetical protein